MLSSMREEGGPPGLLGIVRVSDGAPIVWRAKWGGVGAAEEGREEEEAKWRSGGCREGGFRDGCHKGGHWMRRGEVAKRGSVQGAQDMVGDVAMGWHQLGKVGGAYVQEVLWQGHAKPVWELVRYPLQVRDRLWVWVIWRVMR